MVFIKQKIKVQSSSATVLQYLEAFLLQKTWIEWMVNDQVFADSCVFEQKCIQMLRESHFQGLEFQTTEIDEIELGIIVWQLTEQKGPGF